jgi:hypothetical protein
VPINIASVMWPDETKRTSRLEIITESCPIFLQKTRSGRRLPWARAAQAGDTIDGSENLRWNAIASAAVTTALTDRDCNVSD